MSVQQSFFLILISRLFFYFSFQYSSEGLTAPRAFGLLAALQISFAFIFTTARLFRFFSLAGRLKYPTVVQGMEWENGGGENEIDRRFTKKFNKLG